METAERMSVRTGDVSTASADAGGAAGTPARRTRVSVSPGLPAWLQANGSSLAFTSYQTGQLFQVGTTPDGQIVVDQRSFARAMGLAASPQRLWLASLWQIWRLENVLAPGQLVNGRHDRLYVPRNAQTTGDLDIHEMMVEPSGRVVFVNTKFSCLATTSTVLGFKPLWKPSFVSRLAAEDRCHLNGLCAVDGKVRYVTAAARSDSVDGWRDRRHEGGVLIDVRDDRILCDRLSMPHSPRFAHGSIWLLDSGRGYLCRVDPDNGAVEDVAFCPGFTRGLAICGDHAVVGLSRQRDSSFKGLSLDANLAAKEAEPWCGLQIIDLRSGELVEWIRLTGHVQELFDVAVIPGVRCPAALGLDAPALKTLMNYEPGFGTL